MSSSGRRRRVDCIFCKIIDREIPAKIIAENSGAIAFMDASPISDGHCLVIPKNHCLDMMVASEQDIIDVNLLAKQVAQTIEASKLQPSGFNFLSNQGHLAGQVVFHYHLHVIPKYGKDDGLIISSKPQLEKTIDQVYEILTK